uniref:Putative capsid protein n=1 Tax=Sclerotinia sclerotiorum partitivirus 1 TaxID=1232468 RepID=J9VD97_9VIRU|nr:putative capsid protein [Sclerotinia sclerotiorum partitivirus 1]
MSSSVATRAARIPNKNSTVEFKAVDVPDNSLDILAQFKTATSASTQFANEYVIDFFPNMIVPIMYIMLIANRVSQDSGSRAHPKVSSATISAYLVSLLYGYFLGSDAYVRPSPSSHARVWKNSTYKTEFMEFLMTLPVPDCLLPILNQYAPAQTTRSTNIFCIPSAAGFTLETHFGRFIPVNFFTTLHDLGATLPGNSSPQAVLHELATTILHGFVSNELYVADILGYAYSSSGNGTYINSKFYQIFSSVFNPVLFRDQQRRPTLAATDLIAPSAGTDHPNAYDVLFAASPDNLPELQIVFQTVSAYLDGQLKCSSTLGSLLSKPEGTKIFDHGYSAYALPIWIKNDPTSIGHHTATTRLRLASPAVRAATISFLSPPATRPTAATAVTDVIYDEANPPVTHDLPADTAIHHTWPFSLLSSAAAATVFPVLSTTNAPNGNTVIFNSELHTTPKVMVLDTSDISTIAADLVTLSGKIIESFEIDGSTIEMPNEFKNLGLQNSMFADSAVPYVHCISATAFYPRTAGSILPPLHRSNPTTGRSLPASSLMIDRTMVYLPQVDATDYAHGNMSTSIIDAPAPTGLAGLTQTRRTDWLRYLQSFLGFKTATTVNTTTKLAHMEEQRLLAWSPYSYNPARSSDDHTPAYDAEPHYFLLNLRTFFGTDCKLVMTQHPYKAMPVA